MTKEDLKRVAASHGVVTLLYFAVELPDTNDRVARVLEIFNRIIGEAKDDIQE